jgi:hypothetical protein
MSNPLFKSVFRVIEDHTNRVLEDFVGGNDPMWEVVVPYGRGKNLQMLGVGEFGRFLTRKREVYPDRRGVYRPYVYRIERIG